MNVIVPKIVLQKQWQVMDQFHLIKSFFTSFVDNSTLLFKRLLFFCIFYDLTEERLKDLPLVSEMMREGLTPEDILVKLFDEENVEILDKKPRSFHIRPYLHQIPYRSFERPHWSPQPLGLPQLGLPEADIEEMIKEDHGATALCHFCNRKYHFSEAELREIVKNAKEK